MKILVTGINGQVGWELRRQGEERGVEILGFDHAALDITNRLAVIEIVAASGAALVINCAAYTAVDQAEEEEEKAYAVNRDGPAWLAEACNGNQIPLIHLSTDYVFDGTADRPYSEEDAVSPLGVYGSSKEAGEQEVRARLAEHLILRTSWVYGVHGHNFVKTMLRLAKEHKELRVVADQWGCPTSAADLAGVLLDLAAKIKIGPHYWGTYHCCGATATSWHGFAETLFGLGQGKISHQVEKVIALTSEQYPTPAKRPASSVLDCQKLADDYQIRMPELPESLGQLIKELAAMEQSAP
ncbi:MAG: dTDP-4-dehydrorhamnose reductase [Thermodesulfobacteriota bacterium]